MSTRTTIIVGSIMIVLATLVGLALWDRLPDPMASHWDANDQVNGYMSKFWGVFLMPLMTAGLFLLFLAIPNIDPLKANIAQFREAFNLFIVLFVGFMVYIYFLTLLWNLGYTGFNMSECHAASAGLIVLLHRLPACARQNATSSSASVPPGLFRATRSGMKPTGSAPYCS